MPEMPDTDAHDHASPNGARRRFLRQTAALGSASSALAQLGCSTAKVWDSDAQCRAPDQRVAPAYALDAAMLEGFTRMSEALTGIRPLPPLLAREYLERVATHSRLSEALPKLLKAFAGAAAPAAEPDEDDIERAIFQESALRAVAEQVIYLWYVSAFYLPSPDSADKSVWQYGTAEQYERAFLWHVIRAHVPMTSGGPYGHWASAPTVR